MHHNPPFPHLSLSLTLSLSPCSLFTGLPSPANPNPRYQMPVKRSRVRRSPSFVDTGFLPQAPVPAVVALPEDRWVKRSATRTNSEVAEDLQARPRILTVASPETHRGPDDVPDEKPIGAFLEKCYYCNRKIHENVEVFMYGYLRAFCTSECRDRQMMLDKELKKKSSAEPPMEAMNEHQGRVNHMKNQFGFQKFGFQMEKKAAP